MLVLYPQLQFLHLKHLSCYFLLSPTTAATKLPCLSNIVSFYSFLPI
ncbi:hypothetical protein EVA_21362 [gut metagenome]|uniref:Uncharacterized protein n=1 Tax=gut metagenome TaxID=749906 RepID=J9F6N9_9ZZZZ